MRALRGHHSPHRAGPACDIFLSRLPAPLNCVTEQPKGFARIPVRLSQPLLYWHIHLHVKPVVNATTMHLTHAAERQLAMQPFLVPGLDALADWRLALERDLAA